MNLCNLEDLENGLQQDDWSILSPRFGQESQLEIIGWKGKCSGKKVYIVKCDKCSQDKELFGGGYFKSLKSSLNKGQMPCGCTKSPWWNIDQYSIICKRKATSMGYKFIGFEGEWNGQRTKISLFCNNHGLWNTGTIDSLVNASQGCPGCKKEVVRAKARRPDEDMIQSFFASGAFHPDTKFWRSDRENKQGRAIYWNVNCPVCGVLSEATGSHLQGGHKPCSCSKHRQKEGYINKVFEGSDCVALKFGISNVSDRRVKQQDAASYYKILKYVVYLFSSNGSCKQAERECKQELECGILLRRDMPDGWSETTWVYNLDKIIEIYERNGGIRIE